MKLIDIGGSFDQDAISLLRHQLADHPLMSTSSLVALALRLDPNYVRFHDGDRVVGANMDEILAKDPSRARLRHAIDNLDKAKSFIQIINIRSDPQYDGLLDEIFEQVLPFLPRRDRRLLNRDAAAFLASPRSVTPFHLDHEQNFLCHIRGPKTFYVWDHRDRSVVSEQDMEAFYRRRRLRKSSYRPELQQKALAFDLKPGDCVFLPMGSPHSAATGDDITVTFSVLMNTQSSYEIVETYEVNYELRRLGMSPKPVGASELSDSVKCRALGAFRRVRSLARRRSSERQLRWY
jgi:Cupin-like domain